MWRSTSVVLILCALTSLGARAATPMSSLGLVAATTAAAPAATAGATFQQLAQVPADPIHAGMLLPGPPTIEPGLRVLGAVLVPGKSPPPTSPGGSWVGPAEPVSRTIPPPVLLGPWIPSPRPIASVVVTDPIAAVPEPSQTLLLVVGLAACAFGVRARRPR